MQIDLRDPDGRRIGRIDIDPALRPTRVTIVDSDREVFLNWDTALDDAGQLRRCVVCDCGDVYREKAYPVVLIALIVLGFAGAVIGGLLDAAFGVIDVATTPVLIAVGVVVVMDALILMLTRNRLVCYRCRTSYSGLPIARYHRAWDRAIAERYHEPESESDRTAPAPSSRADRRVQEETSPA
jgi:hypothetical protein